MTTIALLNDALRRTFAGGKVVMTSGVAALAEGELAQVLERVRTFDEFTNDNDPRGEHDFGNFQVGARRRVLTALYIEEQQRWHRHSNPPTAPSP
jgi:hypothetical protein